MKVLEINKDQNVELPTDWLEYSERDRFRLMASFMSMMDKPNEIRPIQVQNEMLRVFTDYRPNLIRHKNEVQEQIQYNLALIAKHIDFAFDVDDKKWLVTPKVDCFGDNPFPSVFGDKVKGMFFDKREYTVRTNMTALQFVTICDILSLMKVEGSDMLNLSKRLAAVIFERVDWETIGKKVTPIHGFAWMLWLSGIIDYFSKDPQYSILFSRDGAAVDNEKLSIGANEGLLSVKAKYANAEDMNVFSFLDAQLMMLKQSVANAKAEKMNVVDIAREMNMSIENVSKFY